MQWSDSKHVSHVGVDIWILHQVLYNCYMILSGRAIEIPD